MPKRDIRSTLVRIGPLMEAAFSVAASVRSQHARIGDAVLCSRRRIETMCCGPERALTVEEISRDDGRRAVARRFGESRDGERNKGDMPRNPKTRVRQHLNPLAARWRGPIVVDASWYENTYTDAKLPLLVDVGCGRGRFAEKTAQLNEGRNVLAMEIREPLVDEARDRAVKRNINNVGYLACNANVSLGAVLEAAPCGALTEITVQFSDPWFKKRHEKRRMVDRPLVAVIHNALRAADAARPARRTVFVQTDVFALAERMRSLFDAHRGLVRDESREWTSDGWLALNPYDVKSEREICVERKNGRVYRTMYTLAAPGWDRGGMYDPVPQRSTADEAIELAIQRLDVFQDDLS